MYTNRLIWATYAPNQPVALRGHFFDRPCNMSLKLFALPECKILHDQSSDRTEPLISLSSPLFSRPFSPALLKSETNPLSLKSPLSFCLILFFYRKSLYKLASSIISIGMIHHFCLLSIVFVNSFVL